jgi:hypothetical protein
MVTMPQESCLAAVDLYNKEMFVQKEIEKVWKMLVNGKKSFGSSSFLIRLLFASLFLWSCGLFASTHLWTLA